MTNRDEVINESVIRRGEIEANTIDIQMDCEGSQNTAYDLFSDHAGSDDDADYLLHTYANDPDSMTDLQPRTIAFLNIVEHIPSNCAYCRH